MHLTKWSTLHSGYERLVEKNNNNNFPFKVRIPEKNRYLKNCLKNNRGNWHRTKPQSVKSVQWSNEKCHLIWDITTNSWRRSASPSNRKKGLKMEASNYNQDSHHIQARGYEGILMRLMTLGEDFDQNHYNKRNSHLHWGIFGCMALFWECACVEDWKQGQHTSQPFQGAKQQNPHSKYRTDSRNYINLVRHNI